MTTHAELGTLERTSLEVLPMALNAKQALQQAHSAENFRAAEQHCATTMSSQSGQTFSISAEGDRSWETPSLRAASDGGAGSAACASQSE